MKHTVRKALPVVTLMHLVKDRNEHLHRGLYGIAGFTELVSREAKIDTVVNNQNKTTHLSLERELPNRVSRIAAANNFWKPIA